MHTEEKEVSRVVEEFSRFAHQYNDYNMIQSRVASELVEKLPSSSYSNVIDIGCGSGEIFKNFQSRNISVTNFVALDSAKTMLDIHPNDKNIFKVCSDFNADSFLESLPVQQYDLLISSSALQWSRDFNFTIEKLSSLSETFYGAIFTSGTFKSLHQTANLLSPIYDDRKVQEFISKYYTNTRFELHHYNLEFNSVREMFKYIKQSGVSGGEKKLSYKQIKKLMEEYPLDYLEFEVLFIEAIR
ncbi:MAG: methyltransferase domain-containing protein [Campylobacterota bacterium]|nr:methyltransferase domain-containing protein [Campylobacterota bacterium]